MTSILYNIALNNCLRLFRRKGVQSFDNKYDLEIRLYKK